MFRLTLRPVGARRDLFDVLDERNNVLVVASRKPVTEACKRLIAKGERSLRPARFSRTSVRPGESAYFDVLSLRTGAAGEIFDDKSSPVTVWLMPFVTPTAVAATGGS